MPQQLQILFIEPFYGGSHQQFVEQWQQHSRHNFTLLRLPAYKWKWRMRHSGLSLANEANELVKRGQHWDVLICSDMLPLAEFLGLVDSSISRLPSVCYFHESQLTYPTSTGEFQDRDYHFVYSNFINSVTSDESWFNSNFHRQQFFGSMAEYLKRMPDNRHLDELNTAETRSRVYSPGVEIHDTIEVPGVECRKRGSLTIVWPHRWEHDKNPDQFIEALQELEKQQIEFQLILLGESFTSAPNTFAQMQIEFKSRIKHCGFVENRTDYFSWLAQGDVAVSTANHEYFGIAMLECAACGLIPLVPKRLAYPEVFEFQNNEDFFYDGTTEDFVTKLGRLAVDEHLPEKKIRARKTAMRYDWPLQAERMDQRLDEMVASGMSGT